MSVIRVAWGSATGPTEMSSYDAALAAANVHNYNLRTVSSVIPANPPVEAVETAPDLGPVGNALTVVQGRDTIAPGTDGPACAGIGWVRSASGRGIFYESSGADPDTVRQTIRDGLADGRRLRDWDWDGGSDERIVVETAERDQDAYVTAVVVAAYGRSRPIVHGSAPEL